MDLKEVGTCVSVDSKVRREQIEEELELVEKKEWVPFKKDEGNPTMYRRLDSIDYTKEELIENGVELLEEFLFRVEDSIITYGNVLSLEDFPFDKEGFNNNENIFYLKNKNIESANRVVSGLADSFNLDEKTDINYHVVNYKIDISNEIDDENYPDSLQSKIQANCKCSSLIDEFYIKAPNMVVSASITDNKPDKENLEIIKNHIMEAKQNNLLPPEIEAYKKLYGDIYIDISPKKQLEVEKGALFSQDDLITLEKNEDGRVVYFRDKNQIGAKSEVSMEDTEDMINEISIEYGFDVSDKKSTYVLSFDDWCIKQN